MDTTGKRAPINTERLAAESPSMRGWVMGGAPEKIEQQEKAGQDSFVMSDTLPAEIHGDRHVLEAAGVTFGEPVKGDPLFVYVQLPKGWKKVRTEHSMWSDLVDEGGVKRAAIFYKAAFYDRCAFLSVTTGGV